MRRMRKSLALLLALAMILTTFTVTTVSAQTFSDVQNHWAESLIDKWSDDGVINGYEDGTFRPDNNITRAELAKIIATAKGYTAEADIAFADVTGDEWFAPDLKKCVAQSVIGGYEDGTFRPDEYITREEAATMFARAYNINATALLNFTDNADISAWAQNSITALVGANVVSGYSDGSFMPKNPISRAEVVKILDGADSAEVLFPQTTSFTGGTNSVGTIGNLGSGSTNTGGGSSSSSSGGYRTVKVTFNANGGSFDSGSETQTVSLSSGSAIGVKAPTATRDGYSFAGWYKTIAAAESIDDTKIWSVTNAVTSSMTLYAGWYVDGNVSVTFELNGGTGNIPVQTVASGSAVTAPSAVPTRANYTFTGWYSDNTMKNAYDFSAAVRKNITIYAGWSLNADYTGTEITLPDETDPESNLKTGSIVAVPPKAIAGETVKLIITPPDGFEVDGIKGITYLASVTDGDTTTEQTVTLDSSDITYDVATDTCSFVIPSDAIGNIKVIPLFEAVVPTPKPTATATAEPETSTEPTATPVPEETPTVYFSSEVFAALNGTMPANTEVGGITVSAECPINSSSKTFDGTGYKYSMRLQLSKNTLTFKVTGPCTITVDAAHASSSGDARKLQVYADSELLGEYSYEVGAVKSAEFVYTGTGGTIMLKPLDNINLYGIWVDYENVVIPTAAPTVNPNTTYDITVDNPENGSLVVTADGKSSDSINSQGIYIDSLLPSDVNISTSDTELGDVIAKEKQSINVNGVDNTAGVFMGFEDLTCFECDAENGSRYIRGVSNPSNVTSTDTAATGSAFEIDAAADGYYRVKIYINKGKSFYAYDYTNAEYFDDYNGIQFDAEAFRNIDFKCEEGGRYRLWANGSKIGIKAITFYPSKIQAKANDTVTVQTKPDDGYVVDTLTTDPETTVTKISDNNYSFAMPAGEVKVNVTFTNPNATPAPVATATTAPTTDPNATPDEPSGYIESNAINTETTWLFNTTLMADLLTETSGKYYITSNKTYNDLVLYATEDSKLEVDNSKKTVGEIEGTGRLKLGGTGQDNGGDSARMLTFMPGVAGTVTIAAAHASSSGTARTLNVYQGDTLLDGGMTFEVGADDAKTFSVKANEIVKIYSASSGINIYCIKFTPAQ